MLKKELPIIPIGLSIFVVMLVLSCALFVKPEPVVPVLPPVVNNDDVTPTPPIPVPPVVPPVVDDDLPDVDTSDWKVYNNKKYGFEIKHPREFSSWEALCSPKRSEIIDIGFRPEDMGGSVLMITILDIPLQELPAYEDSVYGDITDEKIKIGNLTATKFSGQCVGIEKNKYTFFFSSHNIREEDSEIFYQMLSTFKFIEPIDTSTWRVYTNEEYGFEIKHPGDWSVVTRGDYQVHFLDIENPGFDTYSEPGEGNIFITMDKSQNSQNIHSQYFSKSTVIIDGNSAVRYEGIKGGHDKLNPSTIYTSIYLMENDKKLEFYFSDRVSDKNDDKYITIFDQMLSTFKFIK